METINETLGKSWPSVEDWEGHRETIKRLYVDEDRTLSEVMAIMASDFGHRGSIKMYKSRITKWGFRKFNRSSDMAFIARIRAQREARRKPSRFYIRDKEVTSEEVDRYILRKRISTSELALDVEGRATPTYIRCWTPPLEDSAQGESVNPRDNTTWNLEQSPKSSDEGLMPGQNAWSVASYDTGVMDKQLQMSSSGQHPTMSNLLGPRRDQGLGFSRLHSADLNMPRALSLPQELLRMESLFRTVRAYCEQSFESGKWKYDNNSNLISVRGDSTKNTSIYLFYDLIRTAVQLLSQGLYVEGHQALFKGIGLVPDMLRVEGPRTLESILTTLLLVRRRGHIEVYNILQACMKQAAQLVLGNNHPLFQIVQTVRLGSLSSTDDEDTLLRIWRCVSDSFTMRLGHESIAATMCSINYVRAAYEPREPARAENKLRDHLRQLGQLRYNHAVMATLLQLAHNLIIQHKFVEAEAAANEILEKSRMVEDFQQDYEGKVLEIKANICYLRGDSAAAEELLKSSIDHYARLRGVDDSIVINLQIRLEAWLRESGKAAEADVLKQKTEQWLGPS